MTHSFKSISFPQDFSAFKDLRKRAEIEVLGAFDDNLIKLNKYIDKNIQDLGKDAFVHMYSNNILIGQIELGIKNAKGYVHLFYLLPEFRNKGYFKIMHSKAIEILKNNSLDYIRLAAAFSNKRAMQIYEYYGWVNVGNNKNKPGFVNFELDIT